ncbi:uncharacterized protein BCR38DRAFT_404160 [Pseudomassariella vexata]|uniref:Uncharacterized protein n=1 Tax=Pseudomassariella vexata TaxID=1141098 RepID=A0A1Y2EJP5_9PEZI|nr:uncharacterized protein BCR38DRAFT_404160 [Pseudomassariella vexata]ORY71035.1 hypothetical protein BCR38DRAFT_404160 [Pseudomassariella vexata]
MGSTPPVCEFTNKDEPVENQRRRKVRVIGAGYSGIYLACACDTPSHSYQYSFNPNPDWSSFYAPQQEICAYLQRMADKYGIMRFVELSQEVITCRWDEGAKKWFESTIYFPAI